MLANGRDNAGPLLKKGGETCPDGTLEGLSAGGDTRRDPNTTYLNADDDESANISRPQRLRVSQALDTS